MIMLIDSYNARSNFYTIDNPDNIASNWFGRKVGKVDINDYMRFEKGQDAHLEYMTANDYMKGCSEIFNKDINQLYRTLPEKDNVDKYAKNMLDGNIFPLPYLDYVNKGQEGRHRALAVAKAYGEDAVLPVIVITPSQPTDEEIREYARNRWGKSEEDWGYSYCLFKINPDKWDKLYNNDFYDTESGEDEDDDEADFVIDDLDNIEDILDELALEDELDSDLDVEEDDSVDDFLTKAFGSNHKDFDDYSVSDILNGLKKVY